MVQIGQDCESTEKNDSAGKVKNVSSCSENAPIKNHKNTSASRSYHVLNDARNERDANQMKTAGDRGIVGAIDLIFDDFEVDLESDIKLNRN